MLCSANPSPFSLKVEALQGHRVVDIACGSGDAQTLCLTDDDTVWSWGDGDYGKLGRGGSDGCKVPMKVLPILALPSALPAHPSQGSPGALWENTASEPPLLTLCVHFNLLFTFFLVNRVGSWLESVWRA